MLSEEGAHATPGLPSSIHPPSQAEPLENFLVS